MDIELKSFWFYMTWSKLYRVFSVYIVRKYTKIHVNRNSSSAIDNIYCYY